MKISEIFRTILINIRENKSKVFLTTLGIVVGALTIVLVLAIGNGSQASVAEQFSNLNVGTLQIASGFGRQMETLTTNELDGIQQSPSIEKAAMVITGRSQVRYYSDVTEVSVAGITQDLQDINNLKMARGSFISDEQNEFSDRVAVIGMDIAEYFFEDDIWEAVGSNLTINGRSFEIIGVLQRVGESQIRGMNTDEGIYVPYSVAERYIMGRNVFPTIMALAVDIDHVATATEEIRSVLYSSFRTNSEQFMIIDAGSRLESAQASATAMTLMLFAVAAVVLVVGGIGIMNVLFVSVKERTREIGIMKAIGARKRDILLMFLFEAILISGAGAILGILGSLVIIPLMSNFDIRAIPSVFGYLLAFGFSVIIGSFFGYYPASKASTLKPIDALNYE